MKFFGFNLQCWTQNFANNFLFVLKKITAHLQGGLHGGQPEAGGGNRPVMATPMEKGCLAVRGSALHSSKLRVCEHVMPCCIIVICDNFNCQTKCPENQYFESCRCARYPFGPTTQIHQLLNVGLSQKMATLMYFSP